MFFIPNILIALTYNFMVDSSFLLLLNFKVAITKCIRPRYLGAIEVYLRLHRRYLGYLRTIYVHLGLLRGYLESSYLRPT